MTAWMRICDVCYKSWEPHVAQVLYEWEQQREMEDAETQALDTIGDWFRYRARSRINWYQPGLVSEEDI